MIKKRIGKKKTGSEQWLKRSCPAKAGHAVKPSRNGSISAMEWQ